MLSSTSIRTGTGTGRPSSSRAISTRPSWPPPGRSWRRPWMPAWRRGSAADGHIVNLGHGVPPGTDPDVLTRIVARVHGSEEWERTALAGWDGAAHS